MKTEANPKRYRELSEPYPSEEVANQMLEGFFEAVSEARIKFKVPDLLMVAMVTALNSDGKEQLSMSQSSFGDWQKAEGMAAYAYGRTQVEREEFVKQMLSARKR